MPHSPIFRCEDLATVSHKVRPHTSAKSQCMGLGHFTSKQTRLPRSVMLTLTRSSSLSNMLSSRCRHYMSGNPCAPRELVCTILRTHNFKLPCPKHEFKCAQVLSRSFANRAEFKLKSTIGWHRYPESIAGVPRYGASDAAEWLSLVRNTSGRPAWPISRAMHDAISFRS